MQPRPFEEWIEKGHQRDANLCGAYVRDVGGEGVGVKCGCMQGCCEGARPGVRSWQAMVR